MVYMHNGVGSSARAQPHLDQLIEQVRVANGWSSASGKYMTRQKQAHAYIAKHAPDYAIISVDAFLALRKQHDLAVLGTAQIRGAGGTRYHIVTKRAASLSACQTLATNHADDPRFIDRVVSGGEFKLADFKLDKTRRPVQTLKRVIKDRADCALIDNAQRDELARVDGGKALRTLWSGPTLPPMAVVAFPGASQAARAKFKRSLGSLCTGKGKSNCDKVGIIALKPSTQAPFKAVVTAYAP